MLKLKLILDEFYNKISNCMKGRQTLKYYAFS